MIEDFRELTDFQLDVLREIGNIGAGNAATALAQMVNHKIEMVVPRISILPFPEVADTLGGPEALVAGINLKVTGDVTGNMLFLLPIVSAGILVDMLMGRPEGQTGTLEEMERSALKEVGNILSATFLGALSMFTSLVMSPSVPSLAIDMAAALLSSVLSELGEVGNHTLIIESTFVRDGCQVIGYFFLLPEPNSLDRILAALGVNS